MDNLRGVGNGNWQPGLPEDPRGLPGPATPPAGDVPPGTGATSQPTHPAFTDAPHQKARGGEGGPRTGFSVPGGTSSEAASANLTNRARAVRTLADFHEILGSVVALPPEHQVSPLSELTARIPAIDPSKDRHTALQMVCDTTSGLHRRTDCGAIVVQLPHAAASLNDDDLVSGYMLTRNAISAELRTGRMSAENATASLIGLAHILPNVPDSARHIQHAREVQGIIGRLEKLPLQARTATLGWLAQIRFFLSPDAAAIVSDHALRAFQHGGLNDDQRLALAGDMIQGLTEMYNAGAHATGPRFEQEFVRLYEASTREKDPRVRMAMLTKLSGLINGLSPGAARAMREAIHADFVALGNAEPPQMDAQLMQVVEPIFAVIGERADANLAMHPDPLERANLMSQLAQNIQELPNVDQAGPMTNPRVMVYMRLGATMLKEMEHAQGDEHRGALEDVNRLMVAARRHLQPHEVEAINQMLVNAGHTPA